MSDKKALHIGAHEGVEAPEGSEENTFLKGISLWAEVGANLGKSLDRQSAALEKNKLQENTPIAYSYAVSGVFPASGNLLLIVGTPDQGTYWEVAEAAIGGSDVNVAIAGTAGLYVSGSTAATGGLTNLQDYANGLPNVGFYSQKQFVVNDAEYLLATIFNGTPGVTYICSVQVTVYDKRAGGGNVVVAS